MARTRRPGSGQSMTLGVRLAAGWLGLMVFCALFANWIPYLKHPNYLYGFWEDAPRSGGPSWQYWLGTDAASRDNLARLVYGARISMLIAVVAVGFALVVGGWLGMVAGYFRGKSEGVIMMVLDTILAFPPFVLVLVFVFATELRNLLVVSVLLGLAFVPLYARVARARTLTIANREFVTAARAIGTRRFRILHREIAPNVLPTLIAYSLSAAAIVISLEAALSYIGFGVASRLPSWGRMILLSRADIRITVWPMVYPAFTLVATILSLNVLGDWARDRLDARPGL